MKAIDIMKLQINTVASNPAAELASCLFYSRTVAHELHLMTKSFATHKALNDYYDGIVDEVDSFVESYQGKYGLINYKNEVKPLPVEATKYFEDLAKEVESLRYRFSDGYLQQIIDNVLELIYSTIYKLKFLS